MPCSSTTQGAQKSLVVSCDVDYTVPAALLSLPLDTTPAQFSIATAPLQLHSSLLLSVTQSTAHKDSQVHDTARCARGTVTWTANGQCTKIVCADEKLELNDCGSITAIDPKTAHGVWTSPDFPTTFHRPPVEQGRLIVCMECSLQNSTVSLF